MSHVHRTCHLKIPFNSRGHIGQRRSKDASKLTKIFTDEHTIPLAWDQKKSLKLTRERIEQMRQELIRSARDMKYQCGREARLQTIVRREIIIPKTIVPKATKDIDLDAALARAYEMNLAELFSQQNPWLVSPAKNPEPEFETGEEDWIPSNF